MKMTQWDAIVKVGGSISGGIEGSAVGASDLASDLGKLISLWNKYIQLVIGDKHKNKSPS